MANNNAINQEQLSFDSIFDESKETESTKIEPNNKNKTQPIKQDRNTFPINLVIDFNHFIDHIKHNQVSLTKIKEYITKKHLPLIDEQMSIKAQSTPSNAQQEHYPYIHLFYHLALSGHLVEKVSVGSGNLLLKITPRWNAYTELTDTEKYLFLLETFWVDMNWTNLLSKENNRIRVQLLLPDIFTKLLDEKARYRIDLNKETMLANLIYDWNYFLLFIEWFNLWVCERDQEKTDFVKTITLTPFGRNMVTILMCARNIDTWNIALRRENGEVNPLPGTPLPEIFEDTKKIDQSSQPFYLAFADLFPKRDLHGSLPRIERKFTEGAHTFKIALNGKVWRKVVLSAKHTMEDLHNVIIRTFGFDDDHLYSFFMDGKKWSQDCIVAPHDDTGSPNAAEVTIGSVGMRAGQRFMYLFDYGNEWVFTIKVEQIQETEPEPGTQY